MVSRVVTTAAVSNPTEVSRPITISGAISPRSAISPTSAAAGSVPGDGGGVSVHVVNSVPVRQSARYCGVIASLPPGYV